MANWEFGRRRLWKTLIYFNIIPFFRYWQKLFNSNQAKNRQNVGMLILVAGATGGVGTRVVKKLLEQNYQVRALVRDVSRARKVLGNQIELFEADITIPATIKPEMMQGISKVICCTGTKVQPVGGDTPMREKYYQGVKFYLPEVVDVPELVEYEGIKNLIDVVSQNIPKSTEKLIFDFTNPNAQLKETWGAIDDVVMGGVSQSNISLADGKAIFSGIVSTNNNGGFASVRTRNFDTPLDLSAYEGIELKITGDGKRYKFITRCEGKWDGIGYSYSFDTVYNFPTTIRVPFKELIPVFRAKTVTEATRIDASQIYSMQLMLSKFEYDGELNPKFETGSFALHIESIKAYGENATPQFVQISSAGVTRPNRSDINLAEEPPAVRMNEQLGGILTWKLKGESVVRDSGMTYTIIRPCALTEESENKNKSLYFEQGDNLKGQVSRDAIANLCIEAMKSSEAVNKTFEVKETDVEQSNWQNLFQKLTSDLEVTG